MVSARHSFINVHLFELSSSYVVHILAISSQTKPSSIRVNNKHNPRFAEPALFVTELNNDILDILYESLTIKIPYMLSFLLLLVLNGEFRLLPVVIYMS